MSGLPTGCAVRKVSICERGNGPGGSEKEEPRSTCLKSSVMLCHLQNQERCLVKQPSLTFLDDSVHNAAPQYQSSFFQLCRELRDEIYSWVLISRSADYFAQAAACACVNCDDRRRMPVGTKVMPGNSPPMSHDARPTTIGLFQVCRRVYDEARPILHEVNNLYIDGKSNVQHYLFDLSTSFSTHRGIVLPSPFPSNISIPINLVFSFDHVNNASSYKEIYVLQTMKNLNAALRFMPQLYIYKLNIIIHQSRHIQITNYIPLLHALTRLPAVVAGTVTIELSALSTTSEIEVVAAIATDLTTALHAPPVPAHHGISAFEAFGKARARVRQAMKSNETCCYASSLESETLQNYLLDLELRGYETQYWENMMYDEAEARAREEYEMSLLFGDVIVFSEGQAITVT